VHLNKEADWNLSH